jgi:hypothetical protein
LLLFFWCPLPLMLMLALHACPKIQDGDAHYHHQSDKAFKFFILWPGSGGFNVQSDGFN